MGELSPRRPRTLSRYEERQQDRELEAVYHQAEVAEVEVAGINRVTQRALFETMRTAELRKVAEQIAPDGAELYAMIAVAGAVESTRVINNMSAARQRRRYR